MPWWSRRAVEEEESSLRRRVKAVEDDLEDLRNRLKSRLGRLDKRVALLAGEKDDDDDAPNLVTLDRHALTDALRGRGR